VPGAPAPKPSRLFGPGKLPPLFGFAQGQRDGESAQVGATLSRFPGMTMEAVTGTPLAATLKMLTEGGLDEPGICTPARIDPERPFSVLSQLCPGAPHRDEMVFVTRSWESDTRERFRPAAAGAVSMSVNTTAESLGSGEPG